jgi:nucleotide-binding universal stress UspA family protein
MWSTNIRTRRSSTPRRRKRVTLSSWPSHGRHGVAALVLGSETLKMATHYKIPVLVDL